MSSITYTNYPALLAGYEVGSIQEKLKRSLSRLSSGSRIATPEEDPGALGVATKLTATLRQTQATQANVQNALSYLQTQQGMLEITTSTLTRISELATLAQDVTKSDADRANYDAEFQLLQQELLKISSERFNGIRLFVAPPTGGTAASTEGETLTLLTSTDGTQSADLSVPPLVTSPWMNMILNGFVSFSDPVDPSRRIFVPTPPQDIKGYLKDSSEFDLDQTVTVTQNWTDVVRLTPGWNSRSATIPPDTYTVGFNTLPTATSITVQATVSSPAGSAVSNDSFTLNTPTNAPYITSLTYRQLAENFRTGSYIDPLHEGTTLTSSTTVSFDPPASFTRPENGSVTTSITLDTPSETAALEMTLEPWSTNPMAESAANVSGGSLNRDTAKELGTVAELALQSLSQMRATNGAQQMRLQFASENLGTAGTNLESALSRITDVDVAAESTRLARLNILQQSSIAMLSQANAARQGLLRLLVG